jgi:hypothetical protein
MEYFRYKGFFLVGLANIKEVFAFWPKFTDGDTIYMDVALQDV